MRGRGEDVDAYSADHKTLDWEKDLKVALRGIVDVKKAPVKQPKPELNAEDHTGPL